jgi:hypothetical protein
MTEVGTPVTPDAFDIYRGNLDRPLWPGLLAEDYDAVLPKVEAFALSLDEPYFTLDALSDYLEGLQQINIGLPPEEEDWQVLAEDMIADIQDRIDAQGRLLMWVHRINDDGVAEYSLAERVGPEVFAALARLPEVAEVAPAPPSIQPQDRAVKQPIEPVVAQPALVEEAQTQAEIDYSEVTDIIFAEFGEAQTLQARLLVPRVAKRFGISEEAATEILAGAIEHGVLFKQSVAGRKGYSREMPEGKANQGRAEKKSQPLSEAEITAALSVMDTMILPEVQTQQGRTIQQLEDLLGEGLSRDAFRRAIRVLEDFDLLGVVDPKSIRRNLKSPRVLIVDNDLRELWPASRLEYEAQLRTLLRETAS